jgi:hypothetical protein
MYGTVPCGCDYLLHTHYSTHYPCGTTYIAELRTYITAF